MTDERAPQPYRRLLVPFDDSPPAQRALAEAIALARSCGASLELLGVFESGRHASGFEPVQYLVGDLLPRARQRQAQVLQRACAAARRAGVAAQALQVEGDATSLAERVLRHADACGADLLVVGTHGRRRLDRFLLGSIGEELARRARVPVLLLRMPAAGAAAP